MKKCLIMEIASRFEGDSYVHYSSGKTSKPETKRRERIYEYLSNTKPIKRVRTKHQPSQQDTGSSITGTSEVVSVKTAEDLTMGERLQDDLNDDVLTIIEEYQHQPYYFARQLEVHSPITISVAEITTSSISCDEIDGDERDFKALAGQIHWPIGDTIDSR
mmetsp:Transcript_7363/g.10973  ORF Transcript_7363/g.10973 Transcript_7363/m.10973 type:complete len:161 (-) Transcript_7363:749-1231(-)